MGKGERMIEYETEHGRASGYEAAPRGGSGPGVLVLHAWWGLTPFFRGVCDRLAGEGFRAFAPDLYGAGETADTIEEARRLIEAGNSERMSAAALGAAAYLAARSDGRGDGIGALGFSMGAAWALALSGLRPDAVRAVVAYYGTGDADFGAARAAYLGHYANPDEWEPLEDVRRMEADMRAAGREVTFHLYDGAGHWFFEENRPDAYDPAAARLSWERTLAFLRRELPVE